MRPKTVDKKACQKSNGGDPFNHSGLLTLHFAKGLWQCACFSQNLCKLVSYRLCGESSGFALARTVSVTVLEALWVSPCFVPRDCIPAVSQQLTQHMHMSAAQAETCIYSAATQRSCPKETFPRAQYARFFSGRP